MADKKRDMFERKGEVKAAFDAEEAADRPGDSPKPASTYRDRLLFQELKDEVPDGPLRRALDRIDKMEIKIVNLLERRVSTPGPAPSPQGEVPAPRLNQALPIIPPGEIAEIRQEFNDQREDVLRGAGLGPAVDEYRDRRKKEADLGKGQGDEGR